MHQNRLENLNIRSKSSSESSTDHFDPERPDQCPRHPEIKEFESWREENFGRIPGDDSTDPRSPCGINDSLGIYSFQISGFPVIISDTSFTRSLSDLLPPQTMAVSEL